VKRSKGSWEDEQVLSDRKRARVGHRAMTLETINVAIIKVGSIRVFINITLIVFV